jgi:hypothetical protein
MNSKSSVSSGVVIIGTLRGVIRILKNELHLVKEDLKRSFDYYSVINDPNFKGGVIVTGSRSNSFVNIGLENALNLLAGLGGSPISHIGVTDDATVVTATTTKLDPTDDDNVSILAVQSLAVVGRVLSGEATFTNVNADFPYKKIGFLTTATDSGTGLIDVIGGAGTTPYNQAFNIDLTGATTWSATLGIEVEFKAS